MALTADQERVLAALADSLLAAMGQGGGARPAGNAARPEGQQGYSAPQPSTSGGYQNGLAADASEIRSQYADRAVRKDPKRWAGESMIGRTYSQCSPEFLGIAAEAEEFFANKDAASPEPRKTNKGGFWYELNRKEARIMRRFAIEIREGRIKQGTPSPASSGDDPGYDAGGDFEATGGDELPFVRCTDVTPRHIAQRARWERF